MYILTLCLDQKVNGGHFHMVFDVIEHCLTDLEHRIDSKLVPKALHVRQRKTGEDDANLWAWVREALA